MPRIITIPDQIFSGLKHSRFPNLVKLGLRRSNKFFKESYLKAAPPKTNPTIEEIAGEMDNAEPQGLTQLFLQKK
jgi:hypothetical protein